MHTNASKATASLKHNAYACESKNMQSIARNSEAQANKSAICIWSPSEYLVHSLYV